jgi:hypothetical protein
LKCSTLPEMGARLTWTSKTDMNTLTKVPCPSTKPALWKGFIEITLPSAEERIKFSPEGGFLSGSLKKKTKKIVRAKVIPANARNTGRELHAQIANETSEMPRAGRTNVNPSLVI